MPLPFLDTDRLAWLPSLKQLHGAIAINPLMASAAPMSATGQELPYSTRDKFP